MHPALPFIMTAMIMPTEICLHTIVSFQQRQDILVVPEGVLVQRDERHVRKDDDILVTPGRCFQLIGQPLLLLRADAAILFPGLLLLQRLGPCR